MADHLFATRSSQLRYAGKIFAVRTDEVTMPDGASAARDVVENYGAVAVVALDEHGAIPLVHQYRHPLGRRLWELPAGLLDVTGEDPVRGAARELAEEAGLAAAQWRLLVDLASSPGFSDESVRVFLATGISEVPRPEARDEEADLTLRWFPLDEAVAMVLSGEIVNSIAVGGILAAAAVGRGVGDTRRADVTWIDRCTRFAARRDAR